MFLGIGSSRRYTMKDELEPGPSEPDSHVYYEFTLSKIIKEEKDQVLSIATDTAIIFRGNQYPGDNRNFDNCYFPVNERIIRISEFFTDQFNRIRKKK